MRICYNQLTMSPARAFIELVVIGIEIGIGIGIGIQAKKPLEILSNKHAWTASTPRTTPLSLLVTSISDRPS
jgi:hypothetical protein